MSELIDDSFNKSAKTTTKMNRKQAGSNWNNFIQNITQSPKTESTKKSIESQTQSTSKRLSNRKDKNVKLSLVGMDCEMVGIGLNGGEDMLARVSIVDQKGNILIDKFVKPRQAVTDYRTNISGVRPHDIQNGEEFKTIQDEVIKILQNKILIGHSINNDLAVLYIKHPFKLIRDTAKYRPLAKLVSNGSTPSLKRLSKAILGIDIQNGEHSSVEDARAAMQIYNRVSVDWEKYIKKALHRNRNQHRHSGRKF